MTWLGRFKGRLRRQRRIKAARSTSASLREFVYLDEVSVYSLLASRQGALAAEYTDVKTNASRNELAGKVSGGVPVAKAEVSSKLEETLTLSTQTLRKSTIQAAFKEFYEGEEGRLTMRPLDRDSRPPDVESIDDLSAADLQEWVHNAEDFARGDLIEVEVELETDRLFRVSSIMSALGGIFADNPTIFPDPMQSRVSQLSAINRILETLLVGLIPIECKAVDYQVLEVDGQDLIVHKAVLAQLPESVKDGSRPLIVVGVTEERLFWKDIRRVLFSSSRFRALCRLNHTGLRDSWVPVKLINVLGDVVPGLDLKLDSLSRSAFDGSSRSDLSESESLQQVGSVLNAYRNLLCAHHGLDPATEPSAIASEVALKYHHEFGRYDARMAAFKAIAEEFSSKAGADVDPLVAAHLRGLALSEAFLHPDGSPVSLPIRPAKTIEKENRLLVDTEIVAIYW
ncbi:hypothetical protein AB0M02_10515 [Actinoplanes sp. NPDC051861]|uniref:DUF6414 family protein n=1 Tax=Actinoplanes sp. NPDC051861 TaxID=3155170 RepID=UPI00342D2358